MKLIDLIEAIGADVEGDEKIQICHPARSWGNYDEFNAGSKLLKPFYNLKVCCLSAIETDVIRVDLDFDEKEGDTDEKTEIGNSISSDQKEFIDCVNRQPTAFDVDKVVEQIEYRRANFDCKLCKYNDDEKTTCSKDCSDALIDDLIKIVKCGGVE